LSVPGLFGAEIPSVAPGTVGLSPGRLARISAVLSEHVEQDRTAGGVALIARRGQVGYLEPFGMQDREAGVSMRTDTIFRIYQERIFGPLDMVDTGFWAPEAKAGRLAALYTRAADGTVVRSDVPAQASYFRPPKLLSGGGGLASTARDYLRFCQMMLNRGELDGVRLLSPTTVALMTRDHLNGIPVGMWFTGSGFGLGFLVFPGPGIGLDATSAGSYSWGGAASTRFWIDPSEQLIGIFMIQILPDRGVTYGDQFRRMTYAAIAD
jgi:CubicO group peptidase (beta-lactamase class C family)